MNGLLKYLAIVLLFSCFTSAASESFTHADIETLTEKCSEFAQYQHWVYEPHSNIYVNVSNNSFSCNTPQRVIKKNKRAGYNCRNSSLLVHSYKSHSSGIIFTYISKNQHCTPYLANTGHKPISMGKLTI